MRIHAVTFDCWGTLLLDSPGSDERYKPWRVRGIGTALKSLGIEVSSQKLGAAYDATMRRLERTWTRNRDVRIEAHVTALLELVDPALPRRITGEQLAALVDSYVKPALHAPPAIDPGARAAIEALASSGLVLSVVSNTMRTPGSALGEILERAGLRAFKVMTFSDECGIRKPDPEIFHLTLRQMGVAPEHAVHVGDDPVLDVEGAREAGMAVIQVAAEGRATAPVKPDAVVRGLGELPAALDRLARTSAA
jgi:putative hydrolase of the HAD superfamily